jgi:hypothetical protein
MMATSPLPVLAADLPEDDHHRLFVLAHRWALDSATPVSIAVHGVAEVTRTDHTILEPAFRGTR